MVVHGNIKITGHIIQPSDLRAKRNIVECNTAEQLRNVQRLRVVRYTRQTNWKLNLISFNFCHFRYEYEPSFASQLSRDTGCVDTGVIAQEVAQILPEAVRPAGDLILDNGTAVNNFLVVNKVRVSSNNLIKLSTILPESIYLLYNFFSFVDKKMKIYFRRGFSWKI